MNRIWVVDDKIPVHLLGGVGPLPLRFEADVVRYLIENVEASEWEEPRVLELCRELCGGDFSATFFTSPEPMLRALDQDAAPPHAVVFDWEYPGSNENANRAALDRLLSGSFVYAQIYTHLGASTVEPHVGDLRDRFDGRLLPTKGKMNVTAAQLREDITQAWEGTIGGEVADKVRREAFGAVERTLIDIGAVSKDVLSAMAEGRAENLRHLVLAKVRDEIGETGFEALNAVLAGSQSAESNEAVRHLLSVWYYYFPIDNRVRRGDLIELEAGELGFVITPSCDLVKFSKKTGSRLTWLRTVRLDAVGVTALATAGIKINEIGGSIIAKHGKAGETVILLPNVPASRGSRGSLVDYVVLCHAWENRLYNPAPGGALLYEDIIPYSRRCTLADPYASSVIAKIMSVISSPGTPELPKGEVTRLTAVVTASAAAPAAAGKAPDAPVPVPASAIEPAPTPPASAEASPPAIEAPQVTMTDPSAAPSPSDLASEESSGGNK